jgi:hypothetical protein
MLYLTVPADKLAVAGRNTEVGNKNNTSMLPKKSKHMDQLVTVVRDQAAPQQHKLGGQILPQQILEISQPFSERKRAARILQECNSLAPLSQHYLSSILTPISLTFITHNHPPPTAHTSYTSLID